MTTDNTKHVVTGRLPNHISCLRASSSNDTGTAKGSVDDTSSANGGTELIADGRTEAWRSRPRPQAQAEGREAAHSPRLIDATKATPKQVAEEQNGLATEKPLAQTHPFQEAQKKYPTQEPLNRNSRDNLTNRNPQVAHQARSEGMGRSKKRAREHGDPGQMTDIHQTAATQSWRGRGRRRATKPPAGSTVTHNGISPAEKEEQKRRGTPRTSTTPLQQHTHNQQNNQKINREREKREKKKRKKGNTLAAL